MLAIAGGKGGCGKTTTTIGIGRALADLGYRPLLVDADLGMPDLHTRLDLDRDPGLDALGPDTPVEAVARERPAPSGVAVCPAGGATPPVADGLERTNTWEGPVLVDCPAGAGPDAAAPLRVASATVVVSTATATSLADAAKTAAMARTLDAPPACAVVRGSPNVQAVGRLLDCDRVVPVSTVSGPPAADAGLRRAYRRVATRLTDGPAGIGSQRGDRTGGTTPGWAGRK
ncbi:MinD/ParA family protein [Halobacteriales archaeon Cl-PHB]